MGDDEWSRARETASLVISADPDRCAASTYCFVFCASFFCALSLHAALDRLAAHLPFSATRARLPKSDREDWDSRIVSTLMSTFMLRGYTTSATPRLAWDTTALEAVAGASCERDRLMTSLCGYIACDTLLCLRARRRSARRRRTSNARPGAYDDPILLAHHVVVALAFAVGMSSRLATCYMAALLVNEASTPFVNLRALINYASPPPREAGLTRALYVANGLCLVASFGVARVLWTGAICAHIFYAWLQLWRVGLIVRGYRLAVVVALSSLCACHYAINIFWFAQILKHLMRNLFPTQGRRQVKHL